MNTHNITAIGLTDANTAYDSITDIQIKKTHTIISAPSNKKNSSVALIYSNTHYTHKNSETHKDTSGRLLSVTLQPTSQHKPIQIIVIYQPPGLNQAQTIQQNQLPPPTNLKYLHEPIPYKNTEAKQKRQEAERIRQLAKTLRSNTITSLLLGDFNESNLETDNLPTPHAPNPEKTINRMIELDQWTDLYEHNLPPNAPILTTFQNAGHTFRSATGTSSSRLDRILIEPLPQHFIPTWTDDTHTINTKQHKKHDHIPLMAEITLTSHNQQQNQDKEWKRPYLHIPRNITLQESDLISEHINSNLQVKINTWITTLNTITNDSTQHKQLLDTTIC